MRSLWKTTEFDECHSLGRSCTSHAVIHYIVDAVNFLGMSTYHIERKTIQCLEIFLS